MATFAYYNYQFEKIELQGGGLIPDEEMQTNPEESFARKQKILDQLFAEDYEKGGKTIQFYDKKRKLIYGHRYLFRPKDGIIMMYIANERAYWKETKDWGGRMDVEYPRCMVIFDNRPGIQRILIQKRDKAFTQEQMKTLLTNAFTPFFRKESLIFRLDQLHEPDAYWELVGDRVEYPRGFKKAVFYYPYLNLERLQNVMSKYATDLRRSFNSRAEVTVYATYGGNINIDREDELQRQLIESLSGDVGGNTIKLFPRDKGKEPFWVGDKSYRTVLVEEKVLNRLECGGDMFPDEDLDYIKTITKRFIDDNPEDDKTDEKPAQG